MTMPSWPVGVPYAPDLTSLQPIKRMLDPIKTEMEGGNVRLRARPGDNVGILSQSIRMTSDQFDTFKAWVKDTLGNGTARFTAPVRLSHAFETKVCQFEGGAPTVQPIGAKKVNVAMSLRVYGV